MMTPKTTPTHTTATYARLQAQNAALLAALEAATRNHAEHHADYPDELLRLKNRLIAALAEISNLSDDDLADLIGE